MLPALLRRIAVQLFDNGVLRLIFENTRNMAVSSLITAAGLEVVRAGGCGRVRPPGRHPRVVPIVRLGTGDPG